MTKPQILVVIPARAGSKGVVAKNKKDLLGQPLVSYTLGVASKLRSNFHTYISSDDPEIIDIAEAFGIGNNGLRPRKLSTDNALTLDVLHHEISRVEQKLGIVFDAVLLLQPTCPIRNIEHIYDVEKMFINTGMQSSVVSVKQIDSEHPFRMKRMIRENILVNYVDQGFEDMRPRQDLPPVYIRNGSIYLTPASSIRHNDTLVTNEAYGYVMDSVHSINIDNFEDFLVAGYFMQAMAEGAFKTAAV